MVNKNEVNTKGRILYYWARLYTKQLKKGNDYDKLEKAIVILISDKKLQNFEELEYYTEWKIIETKNRKKILTEKLEIHIIELEKIENKENEKDELITWLSFLNNPESERVKEEMENNEALKEAKQKLNQMSEDEYMQRIAELREKAILDENTNKLVSFRKGKEEGKIEGKKEGEKSKQKEIAKAMLKKEMSLELISEITGLALEEIKKINKD